MLQMVKTQLRRSTWATSLAYTADDFVRGVRLRLGDLGTGSGATHAELSAASSVDYIRAVFRDYKHYGDVASFAGTAAELGPGDSAGVGLMLRADGCTSVDLIDRYHSYRDVGHQQRVYEELARQEPDTKLWTSECDDRAFPGINWRIGVAAEQHFSQSASVQKRYDFIVSRSVLEHLYDPLGCIRAMATALTKTGKMIHKVDLRDHGMFAGSGNPLKFLEVPTAIYRRMTRFSGRPNRILFHRYREQLEQLRAHGQLKSTVLVTQLVGVGELVPHVPLAEVPSAAMAEAVDFVEGKRRSFSREFAHVSSTDLAIQGMFIVGTR